MGEALLRVLGSVPLGEFLANLLADLIVVVVGIPIALALNRGQERRQSRLEALKQQEESRQRLSMILHSLKDEMGHNLSELKTRKDALESPAGRKLKTELWRAFSDGGELRWITDVRLLSALADAYYYINSVIALEKQRDALYYATERSSLRARLLTDLALAIVGLATQADQQTLRAVEIIEASLAAPMAREARV